MEIAYTVSLPRDKASVPLARHLCRTSLRDLGVDDVCIDDIALALTEACTNVLKHAGNANDQFEVAVTITETSCDIAVRDRGPGFDHTIRDFELAAPGGVGGRGLHLMSALVDELKLSSGMENGTEVRLTKGLSLDADSVLRAE